MTIKNALIVDDSKSARTMLQRLLKKMDIPALAVESAEEAFTFLENEHPDVIFMDHMMPVMDGLEATQAIKKIPKSQSIPIIMYTSKEDESYLALAKSHGASGILAKPASQKTIAAAIGALEEMTTNEVPEKAVVNTEMNGPSISDIENMIDSRLNDSIVVAKAEITAGLSAPSLNDIESMIDGRVNTSVLAATADMTSGSDSPSVQDIESMIDSRVSTSVSAATANMTTGSDSPSVQDIESMIDSRVSTSVIAAKSEITAGLDSVSHQLTQTSQEHLESVERNLKEQVQALKEQVQTLQEQVVELQDNDALFKRIESKLESKIEKSVSSIEKSSPNNENTINQESVDQLVKEQNFKLNTIEEEHTQLIRDISNKSNQAMIKGSINGAALGAFIAIIASFIL